MDKYDEKAGKICADLRSIRANLEGGYPETRNPIEVIAAFGRACAAEAYEDAAKHHQTESDKNANPKGGWCCTQADAFGRERAHESDADWCREKAAALKSKCAPKEGE